MVRSLFGLLDSLPLIPVGIAGGRLLRMDRVLQLMQCRRSLHRLKQMHHHLRVRRSLFLELQHHHRPYRPVGLTKFYQQSQLYFFVVALPSSCTIVS